MLDDLDQCGERLRAAAADDAMVLAIAALVVAVGLAWVMFLILPEE